MKMKSISLKKMLIVVFLFFILIEAIVFWTVIHITQNSLYAEAVSNSESLLKYYSDQFDTQISLAEKQLQSLAADRSLFEEEVSGEYEEETYLKKIRLKTIMQEILDLNGSLDGIFLYQNDSEDLPFYAVSTKYTNYNEELELQAFAEGEELSLCSGRWFFHQFDQKNYLLYLERGVYGWYGIWIKAQSILQNFELLSPQSQSGLYVCSLDGTILESQSTFSFEGSFLPEDSGSFLKINGQNYIKTVSSVNQEDYVLAALLPEKEILKEISGLRPLWIAAIVINFFLLLLCLFGASRLVYDPLNRLTGHMEKVKAGDLNTRLPLGRQLAEFEEVYNTFNDMQKSILDLKLENYEKQLREERTNRQFLQSQIKSHFYLNCLNIIYMLAQGQKYQLIQELDLCMANYMRYLSRPADQPVTLGAELENIHQYMTIQMLRYRGKISFSCELQEESLRECPIYPMMIQTFVENSMKYAIDPEKETNSLRVTLGYCENDRDMFFVRIQDSGNGFSEELLENLNHPQNMRLEGLSGIGIANVKSRMELFYKGRGRIVFSNREPSGACVELFLPVKNV